ncbi:hypothetical protein [Streptomyces formicae]|uniref:SH3 domain-containing protein n=1 Tax=Streptomyces formicae TaxID=1616117 RepID=A0ABY3WR44_9ACTN|nr:hypothetical protein [Streptomyces formicae]UNM12278.1 hypothetical protein J4032_12695 [Streptomyces formicae]
MRKWQAAILGVTLGTSLAVASVGQAQAAESSSRIGSSAEESYYTALSTRPVYQSPDSNSTVIATVIEGEVINVSGEVIQGPCGTNFRYAWTFNYTTGHFFRGYVDADNLVPYM